MKHLLLLAPLLAVALPGGEAQAQPRPFNCIGAERLEDDVFEIPFAPRSARPSEAARTPVAAAAALAKANPARNLCVLGHAVREGGQATSTQLAARRAREVSELLSVGQGIERDRIRAEARNPGFSSRTPNREARSVTIVVLPAAVDAPPPPAQPAPQRRPGGEAPRSPAVPAPTPPVVTPPVPPSVTPPAVTPPGRPSVPPPAAVSPPPAPPRPAETPKPPPPAEAPRERPPAPPPSPPPAPQTPAPQTPTPQTPGNAVPGNSAPAVVPPGTPPVAPPVAPAPAPQAAPAEAPPAETPSKPE
ncbi:OmpA family protein [Roseomonas sp. USHLN139]|uniref:OmpA family protein n=1 Tax=Roseomonas sp. USHLN139 TaxID=3081298 RepID=UPI003B014BEB